jgi:sulfur-oxidizing protein SoxY
MNLDRRTLLTASAAAAVASFFGTGRAFATVEDVTKAIEEFTGGAEVSEGALTLTTPEIAENGNSVPVSVLVESPMTEDDYVESVMILAEENPLPDVATFHFTPMSGEAKASTRMRLAKTQNVLAVAKMSNGSLYKASNNVKVTIGGCGG